MLKVLGIDVSQKTLDYCLLSDNVPFYNRCLNSEDGYFSLLDLFHSNSVDIIGFEATGVYSKRLQKYFIDNGVNPFIINPVHVSHFRKSLKIHGKTDKSDSFAIALYLQKSDDLSSLDYPIRDYFKPFTTSIIQLDKQKRQLTNLIHSLKNRDDSNIIIPEIESSVDALQHTREVLFAHTVLLLREKCPEYDSIKNDIKGVGDTLLLFVLPYLYDHFDKFTIKQINAFFGLNPVSFQSGTSVKKRDKLSKRGDKYVLKMLYMASVSAVRFNSILREKYLKQKDQGKHSKVALVAVMSHLMRAVVSRLSHHTGRSVKK